MSRCSYKNLTKEKGDGFDAAIATSSIATEFIKYFSYKAERCRSKDE